MKILKIGTIACLTIAILWAFLAIAQLWFDVVSGEIFSKLTMTAVILVAAILVVTLGIREYFAEKEMKAKGFLD